MSKMIKKMMMAKLQLIKFKIWFKMKQKSNFVKFKRGNEI